MSAGPGRRDFMFVMLSRLVAEGRLSLDDRILVTCAGSYDEDVMEAVGFRDFVLTGLDRSPGLRGAAFEIQDAEGKRIKVAKADIEDRKTSDLSLMPNGIVEGITPQDFADLVAYLETLKDASANQAKPGGQ